MSRFCIFLLWFFTHLSFKSGELIKDRRSLPVFQHPKPRHRVKAFRPKSIYGAPQASRLCSHPAPAAVRAVAANVAPFSLPQEETGCSLHQTVNYSSNKSQYFSLSFLTYHYPEIKSWQDFVACSSTVIPACKWWERERNTHTHTHTLTHTEK